MSSSDRTIHPAPIARPMSAPSGPGMQREVASYIAEISLELSALARGVRLDTLAYFIDMVRMEAGITCRRLDGTAGQDGTPSPKSLGG
jgi:hypothetical protein